MKHFSRPSHRTQMQGPNGSRLPADTHSLPAFVCNTLFEPGREVGRCSLSPPPFYPPPNVCVCVSGCQVDCFVGVPTEVRFSLVPFYHLLYDLGDPLSYPNLECEGQKDGPHRWPWCVCTVRDRGLRHRETVKSTVAGNDLGPSDQTSHFGVHTFTMA